jgi:hypothetical protein
MKEGKGGERRPKDMVMLGVTLIQLPTWLCTSLGLVYGPLCQVSTLVARTLPVLYELRRQYQPYNCISLLSKLPEVIIPALYPFYICLDMRHMFISYLFPAKNQSSTSPYPDQPGMKVFL